MKSTATITTPVNLQSKVPYLALHKTTEMIVLVTYQNFYDKKVSGVVVKSSEHSQSLGTTDDDWAVLTCPKDWEVLPAGSTVTLTQE